MLVVLACLAGCACCSLEVAQPFCSQNSQSSHSAASQPASAAAAEASFNFAQLPSLMPDGPARPGSLIAGPGPAGRATVWTTDDWRQWWSDWTVWRCFRFTEVQKSAINDQAVKHGVAGCIVRLAARWNSG